MEIALFCDLNSSAIDLKLLNIKENNIFFDFPTLQNSQASQLLVHATASFINFHTLFYYNSNNYIVIKLTHIVLHDIVNTLLSTGKIDL
jgi:hypothetical protein